LAWTVAFGFGAEFALRIRGVRPWEKLEIKQKIEPKGQLFDRDAQLGFVASPGSFKVTVDGGYAFRVTHSKDRRRLTHRPGPSGAGAPKPELWIFGGSFVHGWFVNDEETFPWLLQERLPDYEVVNFGLGAYGAVQSLMQFKEALKGKSRPKAVILAYLCAQDDWSTYSRNRMKLTASVHRGDPPVAPYARLDRDGSLRYAAAKMEFAEFPLMRRSALMHWLERKYDALESRWGRSHETSKAVIREFALLCRESGIQFILAGLSSDLQTRELLEDFRRRGERTVDISVDMEATENSHLPADNHPSFTAHKRYAAGLLATMQCIMAHATNP
jgi:hypothetical protein